MVDQEPKDFRLGRRAYEAFHDEQPVIWFDQLAHGYQMRWVRAARAIIAEDRSKSQNLSKLEEANEIVANAPRKGMRMNYKTMTPEEAKRVRTAMHRLAMHNRKR